jgi:hypothetical protein
MDSLRFASLFALLANGSPPAHAQSAWEERPIYDFAGGNDGGDAESALTPGLNGGVVLQLVPPATAYFICVSRNIRLPTDVQPYRRQGWPSLRRGPGRRKQQLQHDWKRL